MVKIELLVPKTVFVAGDVVNGTIILTSDKKTECKSFKVVIEGQLTAKATGYETTRKGRTSWKEYTRTFVIHQEEISFGEETAFDPGTQKFDFNFKLPEDVKVSYDGRNGSIKYAISALMDISRRTKLNESKPIKIIQVIDSFPDEVTKEIAEHEGEDVLEVEIDSLKYCIGNKISFRYRVCTDMEFHHLRARIELKEHSILEGKMPKSHTEVLWEEKIFSFNVVRHEWNKWTLNINKEFPPRFSYENIQSGIQLKVTIGRSFRLDKSVEIPLVSGHCLETIDSAEGEVVSEDRPRPNRLKCHTCSYSFKPKDDDVDFGTCPSCGKPIYF